MEFATADRIKSLRDHLASGPNRIALSTAVRGTIAMIFPLVAFPLLGLNDLRYPAVLGALATSMVDVGGPYRTRLVGMLVQALGGPCLLLLGHAAAESWWAAAAVMAAVGIVSGLIRALGPGGASLGTNTAIAFLVGVQLGESRAGHYDAWALGYALGGFWTVIIALAFWQLRPYRRLEQEVAAAWEAVALLLIETADTQRQSVVARRRQEQRIATIYEAARTAVEQARNALGQMRARTAGPGTTVGQLTVLIDAASSIATAAVALSRTGTSGTVELNMETGLARACRAVSQVLLSGKGALSLPQISVHLAGVCTDRDELHWRRQYPRWAQIERHLADAQEALRMLFGVRQGLSAVLRLPIAHGLPPGAFNEAVRTHATPQSAIFRHSMRLAMVCACDTALLVYFKLPHGIWLPLTSVTILQPEYSGTLARALQRSAGTVTGAVLASVLLATVRGNIGYDLALGLLLFTTFLVIRRNYGYGITFLTPIIILLIGMSSPNPWVDLAQRLAYTVAGAVVAIAAGYLLWPQWERDRLRERLAAAIRANKAFIDSVFAALTDSSKAETDWATPRRHAELAVANASAGFQRMLVEPEHRSALLPVAFSLLVYLQRLYRDSAAISLQLRDTSIAAEPLTRLWRLIDAVLEDVGAVVGESRRPVPWPSIGLQLAEATSQLASASPTPADTSVIHLLGRLVSDTNGLLSAAGYERTDETSTAESVASTTR